MYPTNDVFNPINISMMLFNGLFIHFVVVVSPFFGASKDLISDS